MNATAPLLEQLEMIRKTVNRPMTHMETIRHALQSQQARHDNPGLPVLLTPEQKQVVNANIECFEEFLRSPDGRDSWELFYATFTEFVASKNKPVETVEATVETPVGVPDEVY